MHQIGGSEQESISQAIADLARQVNDADVYCSEYTTKEQPRLSHLFTTLARGIRNLKHELQQREGDQQAADVLYRAKRTIFRLQTSCTHGLHKGMPEIVSYLLGKPVPCIPTHSLHSSKLSSYDGVEMPRRMTWLLGHRNP